MGKIIVLMGKSASGKDTIFQLLQADASLKLKRLVPYTTRPVRIEEEEGVAYHFVTEEGFQQLLKEGKVIEHRSYHTIHGLWRYFTAVDGQLDLDTDSYLLIGTLESYLSMVQYFGQDKVVPVMITLEDGLRLERALSRERQQEHPKYEELCRRFLADSADYSEENIKAAKITRTFENQSLERCAAEISTYIQEQLA